MLFRSQFGVRSDARLVEQDRLFGIDPGGEQRGGHLDRVGGEFLRIDRDRQRVEIGEEEQAVAARSEENTSELQSLMRISYAVSCLKHNNKQVRVYDTSRLDKNTHRKQ